MARFRNLEMKKHEIDQLRIEANASNERIPLAR
jgi:hypothetical protein